MSKFEMHYKQFLVSTATFFDNLKEVLPLGALTNKKNKDL